MRTAYSSNKALRVLNKWDARERICPSSPTNHLQHTAENSEYIRRNSCVATCQVCRHCDKHCLCKRKQAERVAAARQRALLELQPVQQLPVIKALSGETCTKCRLDRSRCQCRLCTACYKPKDLCKCPFPSRKPYSRLQRDADLDAIEESCKLHVKLMAAGLITGMELHNYLQYAKRMERRCNARLFMIRQMAADRNTDTASNAPMGATIDL